MKTEKIEYEDGKTLLEAFVACPELLAKSPAVLIFHAWRGRDDFVEKKACALAELGYVGIAADVYGKGILGKSPEENNRLMNPFVQDRAMLKKRLLAAFELAIQHPKVDPGKIAAIGFCFGGLCALDLARSGASLLGVVSFHGLLHAPKESSRIKAKVLALHGHDDPMVPPEEVLAFEKEMTKHNVDWQLHAYGNTMHAFTNPIAHDPNAGTVYNPIAEKRSWITMQNFFTELFEK